MIVEKPFYTILNSSFCEIGHDLELKALVLNYKRSGTSNEFKSLHYELLELFRKVQVNKILVNTVHLGVVAPEDQRWLGQTMIPKLASLTLGKYLFAAVLVPQNIFTKLAVEKVEDISVATGTCTNKHFSSIHEARLWLRDQH